MEPPPPETEAAPPSSGGAAPFSGTPALSNGTEAALSGIEAPPRGNVITAWWSPAYVERLSGPPMRNRAAWEGHASHHETAT